MKHTHYWRLLLIVLMAFACCTALRTASDHDKNVNFKQLKTFNYYDEGLEKLALNNLDKPRVLGSVDKELTKLGFEKSDRPDFLVNVVVLNNLKTKNDWGYSGGGYQWDSSGSGYRWTDSQWGVLPTNKQYNDGTIIIDFLNPNTKNIIWRGLGFNFNLDDYFYRESKINTAVQRILKQYPPSN